MLLYFKHAPPADAVPFIDVKGQLYKSVITPQDFLPEARAIGRAFTSRGAKEDLSLSSAE